MHAYQTPDAVALLPHTVVTIDVIPRNIESIRLGTEVINILPEKHASQNPIDQEAYNKAASYLTGENPGTDRWKKARITMELPWLIRDYCKATFDRIPNDEKQETLDQLYQQFNIKGEESRRLQERIKFALFGSLVPGNDTEAYVIQEVRGMEVQAQFEDIYLLGEVLPKQEGIQIPEDWQPRISAAKVRAAKLEIQRARQENREGKVSEDERPFYEQATLDELVEYAIRVKRLSLDTTDFMQNLKPEARATLVERAMIIEQALGVDPPMRLTQSEIDRMDVLLRELTLEELVDIEKFGNQQVTSGRSDENTGPIEYLISQGLYVPPGEDLFTEIEQYCIRDQEIYAIDPINNRIVHPARLSRNQTMALAYHSAMNMIKSNPFSLIPQTVREQIESYANTTLTKEHKENLFIVIVDVEGRAKNVRIDMTNPVMFIHELAQATLAQREHLNKGTQISTLPMQALKDQYKFYKRYIPDDIQQALESINFELSPLRQEDSETIQATLAGVDSDFDEETDPDHTIRNTIIRNTFLALSTKPQLLLLRYTVSNAIHQQKDHEPNIGALERLYMKLPETRQIDTSPNITEAIADTRKQLINTRRLPQNMRPSLTRELALLETLWQPIINQLRENENTGDPFDLIQKYIQRAHGIDGTMDQIRTLLDTPENTAEIIEDSIRPESDIEQLLHQSDLLGFNIYDAQILARLVPAIEDNSDWWSRNRTNLRRLVHNSMIREAEIYSTDPWIIEHLEISNETAIFKETPDLKSTFSLADLVAEQHKEIIQILGNVTFEEARILVQRSLIIHPEIMTARAIDLDRVARLLTKTVDQKSLLELYKGRTPQDRDEPKELIEIIASQSNNSQPLTPKQITREIIILSIQEAHQAAEELDQKSINLPGIRRGARQKQRIRPNFQAIYGNVKSYLPAETATIIDILVRPINDILQPLVTRTPESNISQAEIDAIITPIELRVLDRNIIPEDRLTALDSLKTEFINATRNPNMSLDAGIEILNTNDILDDNERAYIITQALRELYTGTLNAYKINSIRKELRRIAIQQEIYAIAA